MTFALFSLAGNTPVSNDVFTISAIIIRGLGAMSLEPDNMGTGQEKKPGLLLLGMHNISFTMFAGETGLQKTEFGLLGDKYFIKQCEEW